MESHRRDELVYRYHGELLAELGWIVAPDDGTGYGVHADTHPDVLLLVPLGDYPVRGQLPVWPLQDSGRVRQSERIPLVVLPVNLRCGLRDAPGGVQRVGTQPLDFRGVLRRQIPLAVRIVWVAGRRHVCRLGRNDPQTLRDPKGRRGIREGGNTQSRLITGWADRAANQGRTAARGLKKKRKDRMGTRWQRQ